VKLVLSPIRANVPESFINGRTTMDQLIGSG
jgi:hypothetical protein